MYFALARTAAGLWEAFLVDDIESRGVREANAGRGDFLVIDGERAPFRFGASVGFGGVTIFGVSALPSLLAEVFGLPHAN